MLRTLASALLLLAVPAQAGSTGWFPHKMGDCGWVHGRFAVYNGSGVRRIWVIGTNHILNLPDDDQDVPRELDIGFKKSLYGDFSVCAAEPFRPSHMQLVYIERAKNLVALPLGPGIGKVPSGASDGT